MRPTLGEEPAAEAANLVGYPSGDTVIGLATASYKLFATRCLQTVRLFTALFSPLPAPLNCAPPVPASLGETNLLTTYLVQEQWKAGVSCLPEIDQKSLTK